MNFDFRRGIVYLNNSEKVNLLYFGVDSLEVYYDSEEATCNDRLFNYSKPTQNVILKYNCLEFNIKYIFTLSDNEFMKILKSFLEIKDIDTGEKIEEIESNFDSEFIYKVGEIVSVDNFDDDRWNECTSGIHFFMNRENAINY